jgi:hypothetical protein
MADDFIPKSETRNCDLCVLHGLSPGVSRQ